MTLTTILWKNFLLKRSSPISTASEILIPVAFMALLVLIKSVTTTYDSPNVAYYCGQAAPWYYTDSLVTTASVGPLQCQVKPTQCTEQNYYQSPAYQELIGEVYEQYGYIQSALTAGNAFNPFYTFTVADEAQLYEETGLQNPSLPFVTIVQQLHRHGTLLALAPLQQTTQLTDLTKSLYEYLSNIVDSATSNTNVSSAIYMFSNQDALDNYMISRDYESTGYGAGKVAMAVVLNSANVTAAQWDYSLRFNYSAFPGSFPDVSCLYGPVNSTSCPSTYTIPSTKFFTDEFSKPQSASYLYGYTYSGFATLQQTVDQFILSHYTTDSSGSAPSISASVSLMPTPTYLTDNFGAIISSTLPLFYMLSYLFPVSRIIRALVTDKETRVKEGMKMMGLTSFAYNLSWFITLFVQLTVMVALIILVTANSVFEYSDKLLVFIYLEAYSLAIMSMCFVIAAVFSRARTAALLGTVIFFITYFPYSTVSNPQYSVSTKTLGCLLAPTCFALGTSVFAEYEGGLVGVQWSNASSLSGLNFSYWLCVGMLILDFFLYGLIAWYLDQVLPSEFGTQLPWYFPMLPSYWRQLCSRCSLCFRPKALSALSGVPNAGNEGELKMPLLENEAFGQHQAEFPWYENDVASPDVASAAQAVDQSHVEEPSAEERQFVQEGRAVRIRRLRKTFPSPTGGEDLVAVSNLNLDLYEGQVSVLLGHNGAGKSTTISMLTGLLPPTAGDAFMCGNLSIANGDLPEIRRRLGVCPQHDILFGELTPLQHLEIFASFKGVSKDIHAKAKEMLAEVGLLEKANAKCRTLSGGQKRKLSVGIALIGDSKIVILDEPTSGMDPYSRRSTWSIIQRNRRGRVILLTTHFMDEADILGDRIAIMADGQLQCVGSSLFLKAAYGVGYTLTIIKKQNENGRGEKSESKEISAASLAPDSANLSSAIEAVVSRHLPTAEPLTCVGAELSYRVPLTAASNFPALLDGLDADKERLAIAEYGISVTTMEEVFIRVGRMTGGHVDEVKGQSNSVGRVSSHASPMNVEKLENLVSKEPINDEMLPELKFSDHAAVTDDRELVMFAQQFSALTMKRIIYGRRDKGMFVCQLVLPVLIVIVGLVLNLLQPSLTQPDYVLSSQQYNTDLSSQFRNFVPFYVVPDRGPVNGTAVATTMKAAFSTGDSVSATAVSLTQSTDISVPNSESTTGVFAGCSQGAQPLYNISAFLLQKASSEERGSSRYGAVTISNSSTTDHLLYNVMINGSAIHGVGVYVNEVHQAFLQAVTGRPGATITTHNYPLPQTYSQQQYKAAGDAVVTSTFLMIAFCFVPASFATFVVKEREVRATHQQVISGAGLTAYWLSAWVWDTMSYMPTALAALAVIYAFAVEAYTTGPSRFAVVVVLLLFGPAAASFTYMISFLFSTHTTAQTLVMFINFLTGLCFMILSFVLTVIPATSKINLSLRYLYRLFPAFCLGDSFFQLAMCLDDKCPSINANGYDYTHLVGPFSWDMTGGNITFLAIEALLYMLVTLGVEFSLTFPSLLTWLSSCGIAPEDAMGHVNFEDEDEDVWNERIRVTTNAARDQEKGKGDVVTIVELRKVYATLSYRFNNLLNSLFGCRPAEAAPDGLKVAVQSLCFGVPRGQCFGFLGINGAGKTTTLSIMSGEFPPTSGTAYVDGFAISEDQSKIRRRIGYCPQFDALLELLTVREHIELYGRIKGMCGETLSRVVDRKLDQLDLRAFEHKLAGALSGGNKRKLSVAVATVGEPPIVFLDEPSTGMDPVARRFMWEVISRMSNKDGNCSIILTTHSMEEAEALCSRIGVMVNGRLRCLGSATHLKLRFGVGFEVNVRTVAPSEENLLLLVRGLIEAKALRPELFSSAARPADGGVAADALLLYMVDRIKLDRNAVCAILAHPELTRLPLPAPGALPDGVELLVACDGGAPPCRAILEWLLSEQTALALHSFITELSTGADGGTRSKSANSLSDESAASGAELIERSSALNFKYRLRLPAGMSLGEVFRRFEARRSDLRIQDYSVGQTTLEQIFNQFASGQENPEVARAVSAVKSPLTK